MDRSVFDMHDADVAWCPGCGNFPILNTLKLVFSELDIPPEKLVLVSGIGQAAKIPHYLKCNLFNGLHGRALSPATGAKAVHPDMVVIAESGDGDMYGEGGNHFIHTIRRNPDIINIVHNNMVYGLTKGQASPTSQKGFVTPVQVRGVTMEPFNPVAVAITLNASFVARANAQDVKETAEILKRAITHKGYAFVDVFQPCTVFNKVNTYQWFKEHTYYVDDAYDPTNRMLALEKAFEEEKMPLGVLYVSKERKTFEELTGVYSTDTQPLYARDVDRNALRALIETKRGLD